MGRRTVLLIGALVLAALGTLVIFLYVNSAEDRAQQGTTPVDVLVATERVPAGTTAADASNQGWFETQTVPESARADGALTDVSIISDQVALAPIYPGQQVLAQMFGTSGGTTSLEIAPTKMAISVALDDPPRVAGFVVPGSEVAVIWTDGTGNPTGVIEPKIKVIGVGATTLQTQTTTTEEGESTTEAIPRTIVTLEVTQEQATRIINGQANGDLYLALRGDNARVRFGPVTISDQLLR